jgi:hypothetical protein
MTEHCSTRRYEYVYRWDRQGRKGQFCEMLVRGTLNSCLVEFEDGYQMVTSRNAIKRRRTKQNPERAP